MGMGVCGRGGRKTGAERTSKLGVGSVIYLYRSPSLPIVSKTTPHHLH